jgi:hypothetical protein
LLREGPDELELQKFLEKNLVVFSRFSPTKTFVQPRVLTKFVADFAVLSSNGTLYLIEIEHARHRLLKKSGGKTGSSNLQVGS